MVSLASTSSSSINENLSSETQQESFPEFFQCWIHEQDSYLHQLISVTKSHKSKQEEDAADIEEDERVLVTPLLNQVLNHYDTYYRIKSVWVKKDVLRMLAPSWRSTFEESCLWIGGWRPSMAFHLLYSKSGLQLQARLCDIIRGLTTDDLADLSASQLVLIDELQRTTIRQEKDLTEKLAKQQETVVDASMVELSEIVTELKMSQNGNDETQNSDGGGGGGGDVEERVKSALKSKENGLEKIMEKADELRLKTLKGVIEILSPIQAVYFLMAAAQLHVRLHDWGMKKDADNPNHHHHQHQHGIGIHHSQQDH